MQAHQDVEPMRRQFLRSATMLGAGLALGVAGESPAQEAEAGRRRAAEQPATSDGSGAAVGQSGEIPQRPLGRTGVKVSALGLGGHHLGDCKTVEDAIRLYLTTHNADPKAFVWVKTADDILASIARFALRTSETGHEFGP